MSAIDRIKGAPLASLMLGVAGCALMCAPTPARAARSSTVSLSAVSATGQSYRTDATSWREVLLPDGTSITLGPNSSATVTAFRFDPATGERTLRLSVGTGRIRVASGFKASAAPIEITTPSGTTTLRNGAAIVRVEGATTAATLLSGTSVTVSTASGTQTILRPGFSSRTFGGAPETPERLSSAEIATELAGVTPPADVRMTERGTSARAANAEDDGQADDGRGARKRKKKASKPRRRQVASAAVFTLPMVQNQALRTSLSSQTGGQEPDANRNPVNNGGVSGVNVSNGNLSNGNTAGGNSTGGNNFGSSAGGNASGGGGTVGGGTSNGGAASGGAGSAAIDSNQGSAGTQISLQLGSGLGGIRNNSNQLPTETASSVTAAGGTREFIQINSLRVRQDPSQRLNLPYVYNDLRGAPPASGNFGSGGDVSLLQYYLGESGGYNLEATPFRGQLDNRPTNLALFATPITAQLYFNSQGILQATDSSFNQGVQVNGTVQNFSATTAYAPIPNGNVPDNNFSSGSIRALVGAPYINRLYPAPTGNGSGFGFAESDERPAIVRFSSYDVTPSGGQRFIAFGGPAEGTTTLESASPGFRSKYPVAIGLGSPGTGGSPNLPGTNLPGPGTAFTLTRYRISDGMQGFQTGVILEDQGEAGGSFNRAGIIGFQQNNAFRRENTFVQGSPRGDTDLLVATRGSTNSALRGDLQITQDGRSNVSLTVGTISTNGQRHALDGFLIGSTRGDANSSSIHISGPVGSLGTGASAGDPHFFGGNVRMGALTPDGLRNAVESAYCTANCFGTQGTTRTTDATALSQSLAQERIGYFLLGPTDNGNPAASASITERAANGTTNSYSYTRLAVGHDKLETAPGLVADRAAGVSPTFGYVAAIGESIRPNNGAPTLNLTSLIGTATLGPNTQNNTVNAIIYLDNSDLGTGRADTPLQLRLGGSNVTSAYISNKVYGAQTDQSTTGPAVGLIVAPDDLRVGIADKAKIRTDYQHVQWGYFFGDVVNDGSGRTDHVNLGYLVAGSPTDPNTIRMQGSATYDGHIAGTVYSQNGGFQDRVGTFTNNWSFDQRRGNVTANFADRNYAGTVASPDIASRNLMNGTLSHDLGQSTLQMNGRFFGPVSAEGTPPELGGAIMVRPTAGAIGQPGAQYGQGIFIGKLR